MIVIDETTRFEGADYHLTTQDCAPRESQILCQVFKDGALVTERRFDYSDLLDSEPRERCRSDPFEG